ncbi:MAG: roadblock/LC7 domain-containing protein [Trueperaceae bacterium]|nr:roadblock/LC7 domain-containing protein [Trueperaceae bacterium]
MQDLDDFLTYLVSNIDGALAAVIGDADGLLIEQHPKDGEDLSVLTAQWTNVMTALEAVVASLKAGELKEVMITADRVMGYARNLNDELFCFVLMNPSGNIGKARLYSEQIAKRMLEVFA